MLTAITSGNVTEIIEYSDSAPDDGGTDVDAPNNRAFGELRRQTVKFGNTVVAQFTYDSGIDPRDALGRIVTKTEQIHTTPAHDIVYGYDERGRLESVDDGAGSETFTYDANGNRETYSGPSGSVADANTTYDAQDRLLTYGTKTFQYGHNGELRTVTDGATTTTYTYDALGNLTKVQKTGAPDISYIVDGRGRRIGKKRAASSSAPAVDRRWVYKDGLSPIAEIDGITGNTIARYVYGSRPNVPDLVIRDGKTYRLIVDQLGSPRMAINVANMTDLPYRADYTSFGSQIALGTTSPDWIPFGFAGGIVDADTGLVRFGARDYDASIGRWTAKDPSLFRGGLNLYGYAKNDPINFIDPIGKWPFQSEWQFRDAWNQLFNPGKPRWPGMFPGEGPDWHHNRNRHQEGKCPPRQPDSNMCGGDGSNWTNWGTGNLFHGNQTDMRGRGDLAGVQCIYDKNGDLDDSFYFGGSWDYGPPDDNMRKHITDDVLPWVLFGP